MAKFDARVIHDTIRTIISRYPALAMHANPQDIQFQLSRRLSRFIEDSKHDLTIQDLLRVADANARELSDRYSGYSLMNRPVSLHDVDMGNIEEDFGNRVIYYGDETNQKDPVKQGRKQVARPKSISLKEFQGFREQRVPNTPHEEQSPWGRDVTLDDITPAKRVAEQPEYHEDENHRRVTRNKRTLSVLAAEKSASAHGNEPFAKDQFANLPQTGMDARQGSVFDVDDVAYEPQEAARTASARKGTAKANKALASEKQPVVVKRRKKTAVAPVEVLPLPVMPVPETALEPVQPENTAFEELVESGEVKAIAEPPVKKTARKAKTADATTKTKSSTTKASSTAIKSAKTAKTKRTFVRADETTKQMRALNAPEENKYTRRIRERAGMNHAEFSAKLGVPVSTLKAWEYNLRSPSGAAKVLINMLYKHPELIKYLD